MNTINVLEGDLKQLLSTLKINRQNVPIEALKTVYRKSYYALLENVRSTAAAYAKKIICINLIVNPYYQLDMQVAVINQTIQDSGLLKEMSTCIFQRYDVPQLHHLAKELREKVEHALWPYVNLKTCLVVDLFDMDKEPIIYNTLTKQIYENDMWIDQELNLDGKFLVYSTPKDVFTKNNRKNGDVTNDNTEVRTINHTAIM